MDWSINECGEPIRVPSKREGKPDSEAKPPVTPETIYREGFSDEAHKERLAAAEGSRGMDGERSGVGETGVRTHRSSQDGCIRADERNTQTVPTLLEREGREEVAVERVQSSHTEGKGEQARLAKKCTCGHGYGDHMGIAGDNGCSKCRGCEFFVPDGERVQPEPAKNPEGCICEFAHPSCSYCPVGKSEPVPSTSVEPQVEPRNWIPAHYAPTTEEVASNVEREPLGEEIRREIVVLLERYKIVSGTLDTDHHRIEIDIDHLPPRIKPALTHWGAIYVRDEPADSVSHPSLEQVLQILRRTGRHSGCHCDLCTLAESVRERSKRA